MRRLLRPIVSKSLRIGLRRPICVPTTLGFRLWVHAEDMLSVVMASGFHEREEVRIFRRLQLKPGSVVDAGANVGFFSLLFSKLYPACSIHAIEANPYAAMRLKANLDANPNLSKRISLHECAAGDSEATVRLSCLPGAKGHAWGTVWETVWDTSTDGLVTYEVRMRRVEDLVSAPLRLLKIDVEGFEFEVLKGAERLLEERPIIMIEVALGYLIQRPGVYQKELELANRWDYSLFVVQHGRFVPYELGHGQRVNVWMIPEEVKSKGHIGSVPILPRLRRPR